MSANEERCETCRFWVFTEAHGDSVGDRMGDCRRQPPQLCSAFYEVRGIDVDEDGRSVVDPGSSVFPATGGDQWCGEYRPIGSKLEADWRRDWIAKMGSAALGDWVTKMAKAAVENGLTKDQIYSMTAVDWDDLIFSSPDDITPPAAEP